MIRYPKERSVSKDDYEEWIGVDLDGTLAKYTAWKGPYHIGEPIAPMVNRVKRWTREGVKVKIFTSRAVAGKRMVQRIEDWLQKAGLPPLEVTNEKDPGMIELWDDIKLVQVESNTGAVM